ncbi:Outer membrane protein TolC [Algoriphagus ornithinivorans]|uniref:Outer membrane protein TolC n=1 Tax=Algoriphagus ornithinivorans TaxID=226506 RepID=A0A1I5HRY9_9BACT|nr:TolC family protein [Algoriphagus ornithinivorans]SFO50591.1 Outer membrane protein TolC [Algoriphagus ornithinivorans]
MKKYLLILLCLSLPVLHGNAQEIVRLTLEEALSYSLENNVNVKNAKLETLISKATVKETTATGLPQVNGNFDLNYNPAIPIVFLPNEPPFGDPNVPGDVIPARFGVSYQSNLGVNMTQMIFDGSFFVGLRAAKTYKQLTDLDLVKTKVDVIESVKKAYFGVLVNEERIRLSRANLARIDTLLSETRALNEAGFAEKIDVSRIQVQRNNTATQLERSLTALEISEQILKLQMGLPMEYDLELGESLSQLNPIEEINALLQEEGMERVEVSQLQTNLELVQLDLKNNQSQYMPTIDFIANAQRAGAGNTFNTVFDKQNWFGSSLLGVSMKVPIFDGLSKSARIQKNRLQMMQLENQKFFLQESIKNEVYTAKTNLKNDLNILEIQRENLELAREVYDISKIKYNEGVGSNLEVVEADAALIEAEINYLTALYDGLVAKVDLEKALGILSTNQ